jgi:hypothetical protein
VVVYINASAVVTAAANSFDMSKSTGRFEI